jgi:RNase P subunit RPR2
LSNILERLALLAAQGGPRNRSGNADRFVIEDLLIALGWLGKTHVVELLLVKYAGQDMHTPELLRMLDKRWHQQAAQYRLDEEQIESLCLLAVAEHMDDRRCTHCRGTGEVMRERKGTRLPVVCPSCGGNGRYHYSGRKKAEAVGIHKNTWRDRRIDRLYNRMLGSLGTWESYGRKRLNKYLR